MDKYFSTIIGKQISSYSSRLDINEFLTQCRIAGFFDVSEIQTAIMEQNGKISFLPKSDFRPATPKDFAFTVPEASLFFNVISDGVILEKNLIQLGFDKKWLQHQVSICNAGPIDSIMLGTVDSNGVTNFYKKYTSNSKNDIFL